MDSRNKLGDMAGATADNEQLDIAELLERSDLSAVDQRRVHNASVNSMIDGWTPTRQSVLRLIDFAAGLIDADEYKRWVLDARA
jgi:hypothetical protein